MAKHSERLKREIVQRYLVGSEGYGELAKQYGVSRTHLQRWVANHRAHGERQPDRMREPYSAEFKLKVLRQVQRQSLSDTQAATVFELLGGSGVVALWRRQYDEGGAQALHPKPRGRPPMKVPKPKAAPAAPAKADDKRTLEELRVENELLRTEVAYLKKLDALVRARPPAAPKGRKPSSN